MTLIQPTIQPLYDGRSPTEILSMMLDPTPTNGYDSLRAFWRRSSGDGDFDAAWHQMLLSGFVQNSALPPVQVQPSAAPASTTPASTSAGLDILIRPDPTIWDGSVANNAWLQELPKPLTKTVWENVITIAPHLAAQHKLANGDIAVVQADKQWIAGPVWI